MISSVLNRFLDTRTSLDAPSLTYQLDQFDPGKSREFVKKLEKEMADEHWVSVQKEFPGITREQYEAELETSTQMIREKYYSKNGFLKPRLVKTQ